MSISNGKQIHKKEYVIYSTTGRFISQNIEFHFKNKQKEISKN